MQQVMWLNSIYFLLEHFWMHSFIFSRPWRNRTLIKADALSDLEHMKHSKLGQNFSSNVNDQDFLSFRYEFFCRPQLDKSLYCWSWQRMASCHESNRGSVDTMTYGKTKNCCRNTQSLSECCRTHVHHVIRRSLTATFHLTMPPAFYSYAI